MNINHKEIELDIEGYLVHPEDWNKEIALALAKLENITLTDDYWIIFDFMRGYYNERGVAPDVRHTTKQMAIDFDVDKKSAKAKLFNLFLRLCKANLQNIWHEAPKKLEYRLKALRLLFSLLGLAVELLKGKWNDKELLISA